MKFHVQGFTVEAGSRSEAAAQVARHFGSIADNKVPDSALAIAYTTEGEPQPAQTPPAEEPVETPDPSEEG